jgi:hypothetical protein
MVLAAKTLIVALAGAVVMFGGSAAMAATETKSTVLAPKASYDEIRPWKAQYDEIRPWKASYDEIRPWKAQYDEIRPWKAS